jgi:hypothetical protein
MALLMMAVEGGMFLTAQISVVNAAREGTRYLLDGGADSDLSSLATTTSSRLRVTASTFDVWAIRGSTNAAGTVTFTTVTHPFGNGPASPALTAATVQTRFAGSGAGTAANLQFVAVEVAYRYNAVSGRLVLPARFLTLRSYSLMRKL